MENEIPQELIDIAAREIIRAQGFENVWTTETQRDAEYLAKVALKATGVPRLLEQVAELEAELAEFRGERKATQEAAKKIF